MVKSHYKPTKIPQKFMLEKIKKVILDTLFPISCISCQRPDTWICKKCLKKISSNQNQLCPICEKIQSINGETCFRCKKKYSIDGLLVCTNYQNKTIRKAIHFFKYRFARDIGTDLANIMKRKIALSSLAIPDIITPVPLHPKRLRWRGFNQAEILAQHLSSNITPGLEIEMIPNLLLRKTNTLPQMEIKDHAKRQKNLKDAFCVNTTCPSIKNKNILLIDDVSTTGTTIFECTKVLKKAGAKKVFGVILARPTLKN